MFRELIKVGFSGIETWSQDHGVKLRSQVMRASCLEERRGCLPKSNCQINRLEFILLLGSLWLGIRDRLSENGQETEDSGTTDRF